MRLIRLYAAIALLRGAGIVAGVIAGPDLNAGPTPTHRIMGPTPTHYHPAGYILLASLAGLAICFVWIAMTWRAWG